MRNRCVHSLAWRSLVLVFVALGLAGLSGTGYSAPLAPQATVDLHPTDDAYMWSTGQAVNWSAGFLKLGYSTNAGAYRTVLKFDLSTIPAGATISSAELALFQYMYTGDDDTRSVEARRITSAWAEGMLSWNDNHSPTVVDTASVGGSSARWVTWDVTSLVSQWHTGIHANYGVMLIGSDETGSEDNYFYFYSHEAIEAAYAPLLSVTYTPASPADIRVEPLRLDFTVDVAASSMPVDGEVVAMANPAARYCGKLGYDYRVITREKGEQVGVCDLPQEQSCDGWDFLEGTCGQAYNLCAQRGLETLVRRDGRNPFSATYTECLDPVTGLRSAATDLLYIGAVNTSQLDEDAVPHVPPSIEAVTDLPTSYDWRNVDGGDWTTPIRDQRQCGSCWSFSAAGVTESAINIASNNPDLDLDLAEQHLVADCCTSCGDCAGGSKASGLSYILTYGIPDEACFPYGDGDADGCSLDSYGNCDAASCTYCDSDECSDYRCGDACADVDDRLRFIEHYYPLGSAATTAEIKQALIDHGPLAASLLMNGTFVNGIYQCATNDSTNHAVIIVGYSDVDGGSWIIKNSWGTGWGDSGYFKVGYDTCSIANTVYYAGASPLSYDVMIYNDGGDTLTVSALTPENSSCWLDLDLPYGGLPSVVAPGSFTGFDVAVDAACVADGVYSDTVLIYSNDADENPIGVTVMLTVTGGMPDLTLSGVGVLPDVLVAGQPITWTGTVNNAGNSSAGASTLALQTGPSCGNPGTLLDSTTTPALAPSASSGVELTLSLSNSDAGLFNFIAQADANGDVSESNEGNNSVCLERAVLACRSVTTTADPVAGGTVSAAPSPVCDTGIPGYAEGSVVTLTAHAAAGYVFTGWSEDASGSGNPLLLPLDRDRVVTANFEDAAACYDLSLAVDPALAGSITTDPAPNCNVDQYAAGTEVTLTAEPAAGFAFTAWSGDLSGAANPETITMDTHHSVTAVFGPAATCYDLTLQVDPDSAGSILANPGPDCDGDQYSAGTQVSLTAQAVTGYVFATWTGDIVSTSNPLRVQMSTPLALTASFDTVLATHQVMLPQVLR